MWHSIVLMLHLTTLFFFFTCLWSVPPSLLECVCLSFPQAHLVHLASPVNCVYLLISKQYVVIQNVGDTLLWDAVIKSLLIRITYARLWQNDIKDIAYHGNSQNAVYLWHFIMVTLIYYKLYPVLNSFTHTWLDKMVFLLLVNNDLHSQHNHTTVLNCFTFRQISFICFVQPAHAPLRVWFRGSRLMLTFFYYKT